MTRSKLSKAAKYDRICVALFRMLTKKTRRGALPNELSFDLDDVRAAMARAVSEGEIDTPIKNIADIKYTYDARRELPEEILISGPWTWLQTGKGKYIFLKTKRKNLIDISKYSNETPLIEIVVDQTPPFISEMLGRDEQAMFTRIRHAHLFTIFLGFAAWPIQGHHRTTVSFGQIEIDEVQAGLDGERGTIIPISGKGGQDMLSWSQARNLNAYGHEKSRLPNVAVRSLGLWRDKSETVWIVQFTPEVDIDAIEISKIRRFKFR